MSNSLRKSMSVCGDCFGVFGTFGNDRQLCSCSSPEEHDTLAKENYANKQTYWSHVAEICRCCGSELLEARHKFALWFCPACLGYARGVNEDFGSCVVPVGWHTIVNGVFANSRMCSTPEGARAFSDQMSAFFRESGSVWEWGLDVIERHWKRANLPDGGAVSVDEYLCAIGAKSVSKNDCFKKLAIARGVPRDWQIRRWIN